MKIAFVLPYLPNFRRDFLRIMASEVSSRGDSLLLFYGQPKTSKAISEARFDGVEYRFKTYSTSFLRLNIQYIPGLTQKLFGAKPDVIVIHPRAAILNHYVVYFVAKLFKVRIITWNGVYERLDLPFWVRLVKRMPMTYFYALSSCRVCYSEQQAAQLRRKGINAYAAQNTIDVESIFASNNSRKRTPSLDKNEFNVVYFGAITQHKRLGVLLEAICILAPEHPNIVCNIVGPPSKEKDELMRSVPNGVVHKVKFHEPCYGEDLTRLLASMHAFVMPGIGGLAVNEAMANGLVTVSTPGDGTIPDLIEEGVTGFMVDHTVSAEILAEKLRILLRMDAEHLFLMGIAASEGIVARAPLDGMVSGFLDAIYQ